MKKYEYHVVTAPMKQILGIINNWGKDGWRVVHVFQEASGVMTGSGQSTFQILLEKELD